MDLSKLTTSDRVIAGSAIALLIFSFLPWFGLAGGSRNGWHYLLFGVIPLLLGLAMGAVVVVSRFTTTKLPDLPVSWGQAHLIAGGIAAVLILLKLIIGDKVNVIIRSISLDRKFGLYLSFLAAVGLAVGGFLKTKEPAESAGGAPDA